MADLAKYLIKESAVIPLITRDAGLTQLARTHMTGGHFIKFHSLVAMPSNTPLLGVCAESSLEWGHPGG